MWEQGEKNTHDSSHRLLLNQSSPLKRVPLPLRQKVVVGSPAALLISASRSFTPACIPRSLLLRQLRACAHVEVCYSQTTWPGRKEEECLPVRRDIWGEVADRAVDNGAQVDWF